MELMFLWSDYAIWLIIVIMGYVGVKYASNPLHKPSIQTFLLKPIPLVSIIVLASYIFIGALDSIHFRVVDDLPNRAQKGDIVSTLDIMLTPMRMQTEVSYSAPFALYSFNKSPNINKDGQQNLTELSYKRLQINLNKSEDKYWQDIALLIFKSILLGGAFYCLLFYPWIRHIKNIPLCTKKSLIVVLVILCILVSLIALGQYEYHLMGTSKVGSDILYQNLKSIRTALLIGTLTTLIMLPFAITFGIMAGYFKGRIDDVVSYCYTTLSAIPSVLLIAAMVMSLQLVIDNHNDLFPTMLERADIRLLCLCIILGITSWAGLCRILRGEALKLREIEFVQASIGLGAGHARIIFKHILPNLMPIILISLVLDFSGLVLSEAVLSYVGVGVDPAQYSFGTLINGARLEMARSPVVWWTLCSAFFFMFTLVLSANLFSDALGLALDPKSQRDLQNHG